MRPAYAFHLASRSPGAREFLPSPSFFFSLSLRLCLLVRTIGNCVVEKWSPRPTNYSFSCNSSCPSDISVASIRPVCLACLPATKPATGVLGCIRRIDVIIHAPNSPCSARPRLEIGAARLYRMVSVNYFCILVRATFTSRVIQVRRAPLLPLPRGTE